MAENKRTNEIRLNDLVKISKLYLQGKTQLEIAEVIGVSRVQISYDLKQIFREWKMERIDVFEERLLLELSKIDLVESEAWEAWEKSKKDSEKLVENETKDGKFTSFTVEGQNPNPRFLDRVCWCIETRLKILAVLPKKEKKEALEIDEDNLIEAEIDLPNNNR